MQPNNNTTCDAEVTKLAPSVLPPLLIVEFLLGLPGNLMALYIFCRHLQSWKPSILFLFNLILADFFLLVSMPFRIDAYLHSEIWAFGDAWCRINLFMLAVNRAASISFMTVVAVNRYFKIVHPHNKINYISLRQAGGISCFIWVVVISLRIPLLTNELLIKKDNVSYCRSFSKKDLPFGLKLHYGLYVIEFFLPLLILLFCSIRISCILKQRQMNRDKKVQQAIYTVLVIVGIFIFCFGPGVVIGLIALYMQNRLNVYCNAYKIISQLFVLSIGFTYVNSALDPVIYLFSSSLFRNAIKKCISQIGLGQLQLSRRDSSVIGSDS
ncbi:hydroxycarboxylic acid receptor 2 [Neoarius graeffei]|uniref:hydroxycarboxylic acid receptor 2 n=1 Tax=Neoarius graeffei TaxID=443677 RepID=UPI00298CEE81|nr:hydroxycarboxylic acid receptor 2 [Neoarius graeffei]XP_060780639.1 hydroxycarboxylic acid receptor 2 [Neoarius graeffei]